MKTDNNVIQDFIDYLEARIVPNNNFRKISPRCFLYEDAVDKIFVYIQDKNILIVNDGDNVVDGISYLKINFTESDDLVFNSYRQDILSLF